MSEMKIGNSHGDNPYAVFWAIMYGICDADGERCVPSYGKRKWLAKRGATRSLGEWREWAAHPSKYPAMQHRKVRHA